MLSYPNMYQSCGYVKLNVNRLYHERTNNSQEFFTSAITPMQPAITAAFACAPLIPPKPLVTKTFPARLSSPRYFRPWIQEV